MKEPARAVLITGSSSGIGRAVALHLAEHGFLVFATMRDPASAKAMEELNQPNLIPIANVDMTRPGEIREAVTAVKSSLRSKGLDGLHAIVSNAGGGAIAPLELLDIDIMETELKARVAGPARLVQMLLPEIRRGHGRLLWITTPGLIPLPYKSSVHVSEFAVHALARTFRIELAPWNIPSILIGCGGIRSNAVGRMDRELAQRLTRWPHDQLALYEGQLHGVLERDARIAESGADPRRVAQAVEAALLAPKPKASYRAGVSRILSVVSILPGAWVDRLFSRFVSENRQGG